MVIFGLSFTGFGNSPPSHFWAEIASDKIVTPLFDSWTLVSLWRVMFPGCEDVFSCLFQLISWKSTLFQLSVYLTYWHRKCLVCFATHTHNFHHVWRWYGNLVEIIKCHDIYGSRSSDLPLLMYGNSGPPSKIIKRPTFAHQILWKSDSSIWNYSEFNFSPMCLENAYSHRDQCQWEPLKACPWVILRWMACCVTWCLILFWMYGIYKQKLKMVAAAMLNFSRSSNAHEEWCRAVSFLCPVFSVSRVQHVSDLHSKFALGPHHVWKYGRHPICDGWD